jgi:hypothetical protein
MTDTKHEKCKHCLFFVPLYVEPPKGEKRILCGECQNKKLEKIKSGEKVKRIVDRNQKCKYFVTVYEE